MSARARRQSKAPSWMNEVTDPDEALAGELADEQPQKYIFKLVQKSDVNRTILGRQIFVYWEDYDMWYRAKIKKVDPETFTAVIFYPDTEEEEPDANLGALIDAKQVAFKETRPIEHQLVPGELEHTKEFVAAEKRKRGRPPKGQERPRPTAEEDYAAGDDEFDDEEAAPEESDPSYSSADNKGRKRGRGEEVDTEGRRVSGGGRAPRAAATPRGRWQEEDEEEEAQRLLAQAQGQARYPPPGAALQDDAAVRDKVRTVFTSVLETAAKEVTETDPAAAASLPKPAAVANVVEDELVRLYGGPTKEYKAKVRTLQFNLKEAGNKELRAHVLRGDIAPATLVRMSVTELANKELAAYRVKKEEEALKMSVLDAEAAAKFSTAAALDARDTLALPAAIVTDKLLSAREPSPEKDPVGLSMHASTPRGTNGGGGSGGLASSRSGAFSSPRRGEAMRGPFRSGSKGKDDEEYDPEVGIDVATLGSGGSTGGGTAMPPPSTAIDWASVRAQAVQATNTTLPVDHTQQLEPFGSALSEMQAEQSPAPEPAPHPKSDGLPSVNDLRKVFLPAPTTATLRPAVWGGGVVVPGVGDYHLIADAVAGEQDLAALLGPAKLQVRGRLSLAKLASFLSELHLSKHRLGMLGVLRPAPNALPAERERIAAMVEGYTSQGRAGVGEPFKGVEVYLVPPGDLAKRLLEAGLAAEAGVAAGAAVARGAASPTELHADQMVAMVVYKKGVKVPPAVPSMHVPASYAPATVPMMPAVAAPAATAAPATQHALPPGLDLSALSALAAILPPPGGNTAVPLQYPLAAVPGAVPPMPMMPQPAAVPPPSAAPAAQPGLPAGLDFSALSALAAAFGVAPNPQGPQQ